MAAGKMNLKPEKLVLLLAAIYGTFYLLIVPPWQHYDEPTHFEHAWLIANRQTLPEWEDYDQSMRREVAASMIEHRFFKGLEFQSNLLEQDRAIWLGISTCAHQPFYYLLVAFPLRFIRHADVTFQLYVARFLSLSLFLFTIWIAGRLVGELTPEGHILRWLVPAMMALLPAYTDLMTAVNGDVGATAIFSLFLWGVVRTFMRGVSPARLLWIVMTAVLSLWTKSTAAVALLLVPVSLMLLLAGKVLGRSLWVGVVLTALISLPVLFFWGDAAFWYRRTAQSEPTRQRIDEAPYGQHVLALETTTGGVHQQVSQILLSQDVQRLRGQTVTLGLWIWASEPTIVRSPQIYDGENTTWQPLEIDINPTFHALTTTLSSGAERVTVDLRPLLDEELAEDIIVYYDGLVLARGERQLESPPVFDAGTEKSGLWGETSFTNYLRNGSFERSGPWVRPWVEERIMEPVRKYQHRSPTQFLVSLLDWPRTGWTHRAAAINLLQSFWARFGWNHVDLSAKWEWGMSCYWGLGILTAIGVLGGLRGLLQRWSSHPLPWLISMVFLVMAGLMVWGNAFVRPHPLRVKPLIPAARYAYPAIIPTVIALMGGWLSWAPRGLRAKVGLGLLLGLFMLDVASLIAIWTFYYGGN